MMIKDGRLRTHRDMTVALYSGIRIQMDHCSYLTNRDFFPIFIENRD